jgi:glycosyltransferase involved in cell wall biosynthesis
MMPTVLFVLANPTPQRTPVMDSLFEHGVDLKVLYHESQDVLHGWGTVPTRHPAATIPSGVVRSCLFAIRQTRDPELAVFCCFGYSRPADIAGVLAARARGVAVVTRSDSNWIHERARPALRRRLKRVLLRLLFGRRARVWTIGIQNERYWREMGLLNQHTIPYGMPRPPIGSAEQGREFRRAHGLGSGMVFLYTGNLEPHKGVDTLLAAFRATPAPTARLVVVGRGSLAEAVAAAAWEDPRILVCGALDHDALAPVYAAADLLVLPSRLDAWGLVVNEAQANGLRVVVSDAVGCAADLVDAANGYVFTAGDVDSLRTVLSTALDQHARGWPRLPRREAYDATEEMLRDLEQLGAAPAPTRSLR